MALHPANALISDWITFDRPGRVTLRTGKVELGQGIYAALKRIVAEELDVRPERVDVSGADTALTLDEGVTAGSMSVSSTGTSVGRAAAGARSLFVSALKAGGAEGAVTVEDGQFIVDGQLCGEDYWTLASAVGLAEPIAPPSGMKDPAAYRVLGKAGYRHELLPMVSGAPFIQDLMLPGMLHGRMVRPPFPLAVLDSLGLDLPPDVTLVQDGAFLGIIAQDEYRAVRTAQRIELRARWSGVEEDASPWTRIGSSNMPAGDPSTHLPPGRTISATISRPFLAHASIGLCCAVASWDDDRLTVWTHSQGVFQLRFSLAALLGLPEARIHVIHVRGAGCYGHNGADDVAADAALLSLSVPGQPVRVLWTRQQELVSGPLAPAMRSSATATLDPSGRIIAFRTNIVSYPHARRPSMAGGINLLAGYLRRERVTDPIIEPPAEIGGGAIRNAEPFYDIPDIDVSLLIVEAPAVRTSALRTLGAHVNVSAVESAIDEAAAATGADPVAFRLSHLSDPRARAVIERAAALAGWPGDGGLGIGFARYKNKAAYCAVVARISLDEAVRVERLWCCVDAGRVVDPDGLSNQIEGGMVQSTSWTLKEMLPFEAGRPAITGWADYPVLTFGEVPDITVEIIDRPLEASLGAGEASSGPTAAAICNAVAATLGIRIGEFPITRDRIIEALG